jgi:ADP-ribosylglycohydrolase
MALSILEVLAEHNEIDQDALARSFAGRYDPGRGYGQAMHGLLMAIRRNQSWRTEASALFHGDGSYGNGSAMRVAPLGAYFADDPEKIVEQATLSSIVTHTHKEGITGAIAIALAAGMAWRMKDSGLAPDGFELLRHVHEHVPESHVRLGIQNAMELAADSSIQKVVSRLGNGSAVTAPDTVPFALWCAAQNLNDYQEALWTTVSGLGDRDTTCAIVGGIVAMYVGKEGIPPEWITRCERLPAWVR